MLSLFMRQRSIPLQAAEDLTEEEVLAVCAFVMQPMAPRLQAELNGLSPERQIQLSMSPRCREPIRELTQHLKFMSSMLMELLEVASAEQLQKDLMSSHDRTRLQAASIVQRYSIERAKLRAQLEMHRQEPTTTEPVLDGTSPAEMTQQERLDEIRLLTRGSA